MGATYVAERLRCWPPRFPLIGCAILGWRGVGNMIRMGGPLRLCGWTDPTVEASRKRREAQGAVDGLGG